MSQGVSDNGACLLTSERPRLAGQSDTWTRQAPCRRGATTASIIHKHVLRTAIDVCRDTKAAPRPGVSCWDSEGADLPDAKATDHSGLFSKGSYYWTNFVPGITPLKPICGFPQGEGFVD